MNPRLLREMAQDAQSAFLAALDAVDPTRLVKQQVRTGALDDWFQSRDAPRSIHVLAIGKAAPRMVWGLVEANVPFSGLGVAPTGQRRPLWDGFTWHDGDHPVPGAMSLAAGEALWTWCTRLPPDAPVLVLLSGGASACVEAYRDGVDPDAAREDWKEWLREGLEITEMNRRRGAQSRIKAGGLARALGDRPVRVWLLADAPDPATVGSGPCWTGSEGPEHTVLADNGTFQDAAAATLTALGWTVHRVPTRIQGDTEVAAQAFADALAAGTDAAGSPGSRTALVGGGETTHTLAPDAPLGGRCQHAALAAAMHLPDASVVAVLASDGVDGTTREAGAWVDAGLAGDGARSALRRWDAHRFLADHGRTVRTGPTGTNVNDLWIGLRVT